MIAHSMRYYSIRCPTMTAQMMWIMWIPAIVFAFGRRCRTSTFPRDGKLLHLGRAHVRRRDQRPMLGRSHTIHSWNSISCDIDTMAWCCLIIKCCAPTVVVVFAVVTAAAEVDSSPMNDDGNRSLCTSTSVPWNP